MISRVYDRRDSL